MSIAFSKPTKYSLLELVEALWWSHGGFDVQRANVLPVLLEQRDQEVDRQVNVLHKLVLAHVDVSNTDRQAQDLFEKRKKSVSK